MLRKAGSAQDPAFILVTGNNAHVHALVHFAEILLDSLYSEITSMGHIVAYTAAFGFLPVKIDPFHLLPTPFRFLLPLTALNLNYQVSKKTPLDRGVQLNE